jgi:hypothetical protein
MLTYNRYRERLTPAYADPAVADPAEIDSASYEGFTTLGFSLRYDLTPTSALKFQFDRWLDKSGPNFNLNANGTSIGYGNARLITFSYDLVF